MKKIVLLRILFTVMNFRAPEFSSFLKIVQNTSLSISGNARKKKKKRINKVEAHFSQKIK